MTKEKYRPTTPDTALARLIEECGEVIVEGCKILRFGAYNFHPEDLNQSTNIERVRTEIQDLKIAIEDFERLTQGW